MLSGPQDLVQFPNKHDHQVITASLTCCTNMIITLIVDMHLLDDEFKTAVMEVKEVSRVSTLHALEYPKT
jgi:hypothetical protein